MVSAGLHRPTSFQAKADGPPRPGPVSYTHLDVYKRQALLSHKHLLARISAERVTHELDGFVRGAFVHDALMRTVDVLAAVLPELVAMKGFDQRSPYHIYDVLEHTCLLYTSRCV